MAGTVQAITLSGLDAESDALTYSIVSQPANGSLAGTPPNLTYSPDPGFTGTDIFTFKVNDGKVDSDPVTVTLLVTNSTIPTSSSKVYLPVIERQATAQN